MTRLPPLLVTAGIEAIDEILADGFRIDVFKALNPLDPDDFLLITNNLADALRGAMAGAEAQALRAALALLDVDWRRITPARRERVVLAARDAIAATASPRVLPRIAQTFQIAHEKTVKGTRQRVVEEFGLDIGVRTGAAGADTGASARASQAAASFVRDEYGRRADAASRIVRGIVADGIEKGYDRNEIGGRIATALEGQGIRRSRAYYNMAAGVHLARARSFSTLTSFADAAIQHFKFEAVLDELTTPQCRFLHGRSFEVSVALQKIAEVDGAEDPGEVAHVTPWIQTGKDDTGAEYLYVKERDGSRSRIAEIDDAARGRLDDTGKFRPGLSDAALAARGVVTPPVHANCRSTIVPDFTETTTVSAPAPRPPRAPRAAKPPTPAARPEGPPFETRAEVGRYLDAAPAGAKRGEVDLSNDPKIPIAKPYRFDEFPGPVSYEEIDPKTVNVGSGVMKKSELDKAVKYLAAGAEGPPPRIVEVVRYKGQLYARENGEMVAAAHLLNGDRKIQAKIIDADSEEAGFLPSQPPWYDPKKHGRLSPEQLRPFAEVFGASVHTFSDEPRDAVNVGLSISRPIGEGGSRAVYYDALETHARANITPEARAAADTLPPEGVGRAWLALPPGDRGRLPPERLNAAMLEASAGRLPPPVLVASGGRYYPADEEQIVRAMAHAAIADRSGSNPAVPARVIRQPSTEDPRAISARAAKGLADNDPIEVRSAFRDYLEKQGIQSRDMARSGLSGALSYDASLTQPNARAVHHWNGRVSVKPLVADQAREGLRKHAAGEPLTPDEVRAVSTFFHEELHGASPIVASAYARHGVPIEEVGTELLARRYTRKLLGENAARTNAVADPVFQQYSDGTSEYVSGGDPGSYDRYIFAMCKHTHAAIGGNPDEAPGKLADAYAKMRSPSVATYNTPDEHANALAEALGIERAKRAEFIRAIKNDPNLREN